MNQIIQNPYVQAPPPFLSDQEIDVLKRTLLKQFSEEEQESFIRLCQRNQLDPFSKQIFATRRWSKDWQGNKIATLTTVTSIMGLTAIAVRTGHYDGCVITWAGKDGVWKDEWLEEEFPVAAKCVVYHKQRTHPEVGIARWDGYVGRKQDYQTKRYEVTDFWARLPDYMIGKCAKAQALRGAFPDQCSNLYISEELQGGISEGADDMDDERKITRNREREEELLKTAKASGVRVVESKPAKRPTAAEAAAEAEPPKAVAAAPVAAKAPAPIAESPQTEPDDLDMGAPAAQPPQPDVEEPAGPPVESWRFHVIEGLKASQFRGRTVSDLSIVELQAIEDKWFPKVREVWATGGTVSKAQEADFKAFEAALAASRQEKPW